MLNGMYCELLEATNGNVAETIETLKALQWLSEKGKFSLLYDGPKTRAEQTPACLSALLGSGTTCASKCSHSVYGALPAGLIGQPWKEGYGRFDRQTTVGYGGFCSDCASVGVNRQPQLESELIGNITNYHNWLVFLHV